MPARLQNANRLKKSKKTLDMVQCVTFARFSQVPLPLQVQTHRQATQNRQHYFQVQIRNEHQAQTSCLKLFKQLCS